MTAFSRDGDPGSLPWEFHRKLLEPREQSVNTDAAARALDLPLPSVTSELLSPTAVPAPSNPRFQ